jgi:ankyrin repeat protein
LASVSGDDPMSHPLKLAAAIGRSDVIKSFISFGVDIMPIKDELITIASKAKRHEVIAYFKSIDLINDEYDPSCDSCYNITVIDNQGRGSLHYAVEKSNIDRVRALISLGANINSLDINKISVLHLAMQDWDVDIMIELISSGANTEIYNEDGIGIMQCAISYAEIAVVDEILFHNPTDVNFIFKDNVSPMHQACALDHPGNYDIVALLIEAKADLNLLNDDYKTPLQCILEGNIQNTYEIATSLILNGGNLEFLENTDQHESIKPLFSNNGWQDIHMQIFFGYELDLDKAASLMLSSNTSDIMLHPVKLAVVVGNLAALRQLVMHGVEVTSLKDELRCIASRAGSNDIVSYIERDFYNSKMKRDINSIFSENEGVVFYDSRACANPDKAGLKI